MADLEGLVRRIDRFQQRHRVLAFTFGVVKKFGDDQGGNLAALITYYGFLSLFPLLLVLVTVLGFVLDGNPGLRDDIVESALADFPVIGDQIRSNVGSVRGSGIGLAVGLAGTFWGGLGIANAAQDAMNRVWEVPMRQRPGFVPRVLRSVGLIATLGVGVLVTVVLSGLGGGGGGLAVGLRVASIALSLALSVVLFAVAFRVLTSRDLSWRDVLPGAVVAATGWQILQTVGGAVRRAPAARHERDLRVVRDRHRAAHVDLPPGATGGVRGGGQRREGAAAVAAQHRAAAAHRRRPPRVRGLREDGGAPAGAPRGARRPSRARRKPARGRFPPLTAWAGPAPGAYRVGVPYATRPVHDADSHIMEPADWLHPYLDAATRERFPLVWTATDEDTTPADAVQKATRLHRDPAYRAEDASQITLRKNFLATGSFLKEDRAAALDHLGFASQLVFDTFTSPHALRFDRDGDHALACAIAEAQHRAVLDWCAVDPRLLPVTVVPVGDMDAAARLARAAIEAGSAAIWIGQYPAGHSPSHVALEPVWAMCAEAGVPLVLHVAGAGANVMPPDYFDNGLPPVPDFHGGDTNFKSIDYLSIPLPVMQTLNALVVDGVLMRHPRLRVGVIELGATWVPGWMRMLDSAHEAFRKNEERLQRMDMKPSEYVRRQVRVTPYPHEDTGWTIANAGPDVCMFSSDFPHVEGGRNPVARFERSMDAAAIDEHARDRFYRENFVDLLGPVLARRGVVAAS
jgi:YihY family inner membrane protein